MVSVNGTMVRHEMRQFHIYESLETLHTCNGWDLGKEIPWAEFRSVEKIVIMCKLSQGSHQWI
jgi:hypothetical protein